MRPTFAGLGEGRLPKIGAFHAMDMEMRKEATWRACDFATL